MLTGRRFRLLVETMAVEEAGDHRIAVLIPAGTVVKVVSGPTPGDRMLDVLWEARHLSLFAIDLQKRGEEVHDASTA